MSTDVVITTVLSPAATYDLTDLETTKDELSIKHTDSNNDTWLARAITQVSRAVMNETSRVFAPEYVQDAFDIPRRRMQVPSGLKALQLTRWPVLAIVSVVQTSITGPTTLTNGVDFEVDPPTGELYRLDATTGVVTAWEPMPTAVKYSAGYGSAVLEAHTVPASGSYIVTVSQAPLFSCDQTVTYANGTVLTPVSASPAVGQYAVVKGVYTFNAADASKALSFTYCILDLPDDLTEIGLRLVTARYRSKDRDPSLVQMDTPGIGTQRWWFGGAPGQRGAFPPDIQSMLDNYGIPTVA